MSQSSGCVCSPAHIFEQSAEQIANIILQDEILLVDSFQQLPAQAVDRLALLVHDVVVLEQVFTGFEVLRFHGLLRGLDAAGDQPRFDRNAFFHAKALEQRANPFLGEDAHQVVFEREIEARGTGVALAAGASTKLIIDAARLVSFGAENEQARPRQ